MHTKLLCWNTWKVGPVVKRVSSLTISFYELDQEQKQRFNKSSENSLLWTLLIVHSGALFSLWQVIEDAFGKGRDCMFGLFSTNLGVLVRDFPFTSVLSFSFPSQLLFFFAPLISLSFSRFFMMRTGFDLGFLYSDSLGLCGCSFCGPLDWVWLGSWFPMIKG